MKKIIELIKKFLENDTVERVYKTFFQAFIGYILAVNIAEISNLEDAKEVLFIGFTTGVCAVWNYIKVKIDEKLNN